MRTLKKVLALTVVLATLLSISAFAGFSDEDKIDDNFVDAVNLLGALNVMTGDTEGTFRPNDTISRAEAAKMIYVIRNGGVDDKAAGWTGMTTFSDVASGVWYEGYVNYCASLGIIAGIGGGKFNPSGAVTGVELAKMLLVVADYKPDVEGYTGTGWNLNVIRDAQSAGMFKGYTLAYSAAATRQQAAQLFSNAILETQMAVYIGDTRVNDLANITQTGTIGGRFFDLKIVTGVLTKVPHVSLPVEVAAATNNAPADVDLSLDTTSALNANDKLACIERFNDADHLNNVNANALTFEFDADPDLLYQEVTVIYQEANEGGILDRKSKVYAVLGTGHSYVYETTMDGITIELDDDSKGLSNDNPAVIKFEGYNGGRAKALTDALPVVTNLYEGAQVDPVNMGTHKASWDKDVYLINEANTRMLATTSTAPVRLIDIDGNGELDVAFVTTPYYGTVSSYNPDRYEFTTSATLDAAGRNNITTNRRQENFKNFTFADDLKKDDVIAIEIDVLSGEILYKVSLVELTKGQVTYVYSTDPDNEVIVGGETYGFYGLRFDGKLLTELNPVLEADRYHKELGKEVSVYTDGKYIISAKVAPESIGTNFAFVKNYNPEGNSFNPMPDDSQALLLELVLANGETVVKEYDVDEVNSTTSNYFTETEVRTMLANGKLVGNIVEYSSKGNYVAFRNNHNTPVNADPLYAIYHNTNTTSGNKYTFDSATGLFRVTGGNQAFDVNEDSVFFLPTFKSSADPANLGRNDITKVSVIKGSDLRGTPTITTVEDTTTANDVIMRLVSCMQSGVRTAAYGVLDADSTVSDTGIFAYALTNDWDKDDDDEDARQVRAVVSDSGSDEGAIINLDNSNILANKVYRATRNSDGTYTLDQIINGETVDGATMRLGTINGRRGNNVTINGNVYSVTQETVIFVVDIDARGSMTRINLGDVSDLTEAALVKGTTNQYYNNVLFESANNELSVVYVEAVGMDVTQLINYRAVNTVTAETPALAAGMNTEQANTAVKAAMPKTADVSLDNWAPNTFPMEAGINYSVDVTLTPKAGTTFEVDGNGNFTVKVGNSSYSGALNTDGSFTFTLNNLAATNGKITSADVTTPVAVANLNELQSPNNVPNTHANTLTAGVINHVNSGNALTGTSVTWYAYQGSNPDTAVVAGATYELRFTLMADANYQFAQDFTLNVANATDVQLTFNQDYTQVTVSALASMADIIGLSGNALPATLTHGAELKESTGDVTVDAPYNTDVTVSAVAWNGDVANAGHATFNEALTVDVTLTAQNGFTFEGLDANSFAANGYVVTSVEKVGRDNLTVIVHMNAPAVAKADITEVELNGLTKPNANDPLNGQNVTATGTPANSVDVDVDIVGWYSDAGCATSITNAVNSGDNYVKITLTAKAGYVFKTGFTTGDVDTTNISGYSVESVQLDSAAEVATVVLKVTSN